MNGHRRIRARILPVLLAYAGLAWMALPVTDFVAPGTPSSGLNGSWSVLRGSFAYDASTGDQVHSTNGPGDSSVAIWTADVFANDQYSQITIGGGFSTNGQVGPMIRTSTSSGVQGYFANVAFGGPTDIVLYLVTGGTSYTALQDFGTSATGADVIYIDGTGSTLVVKKNGSQIGTNQTDATIASGSAGIISYESSGYIELWSAGNVGGGSPPASSRRRMLIGVGK